MSFPTSPSDGQTYLNARSTLYQYSSARQAWEIVSQAVTGNQGIQGNTGIQGYTGTQGVTGFVFSEYQNTAMTNSGKMINWTNGLKQTVPVGFTGSLYNIGFIGGNTGMNGTLRIKYVANEAPGITGCKWPNGVRPTLSGYTGAEDMVSVYYNGVTYYAQASLYFVLA